jgi:hypothetical protein
MINIFTLYGGVRTGAPVVLMDPSVGYSGYPGHLGYMGSLYPQHPATAGHELPRPMHEHHQLNLYGTFCNPAQYLSVGAVSG